jgi:gamma-glutamyltranspeptidase/glutathione hydrolase
MKRTLILLASLGISSFARTDLRRNFATRSEVVKWNGGFKSATCDPNGLDILKKGGTAVDAIAVNAALGLMEPTGSGVGGDLFAIVWDAKTEKLYINASGRSQRH